MAVRLGKHLGAVLPIALILVLAVVVRVFYLHEYHQLLDWNLLSVDNYYHHNWAQDIAGGNLFGDTTYFRAPFYVFCLAALYAVFEASVLTARIFGLVVGLVSITMTFLLGRKLHSQKLGLAAAAVHALYPAMIYFETELLLDPLFTLLVQGVVLGTLYLRERVIARNLFIVGVLLGLAAITRPTALVLIPIVIILILMKTRPWKQVSRQLLVLAAGLILIVGPVFLRNLVVADDPVLIASQGGINLYIGNNEAADGLSAVMPEPLGHNWQIKDITHIAESAEGKRLKPGEVSTHWTGEAITWITDNPMGFVKLVLKKIYFVLSNREISNNRSLPLFFHKVSILRYNPLSFGILLPLAVLGGLTALARRHPMRILIPVVAFYGAALALFFISSRFRMPLLPYFILLAVYGAMVSIDLISKNARRTIGLAVGFLLIGWFSFYPVVPLPERYPVSALSSAGLYYYDRGDYRQALDYYRSAADIDPTYPEVNLNLGACYYRLGIADSALYHFQTEIRLHPDRSKAYGNLASYYLVNSQYGQAAREAEAALSRKPYALMPNTVLLRAVANDSTVTNDSLWSLVQMVVQATQDNLFLLNEAAGFLSRRGDNLKAENLLRRAERSLPSPVETDDLLFSGRYFESRNRFHRERAKTEYLLGYISGLRGAFGQAVMYSRAAIAIDPDLAEAYVNLISGHLALGQAEAADSILYRALSLFPDNSSLRSIEALRQN